MCSKKFRNHKISWKLEILYFDHYNSEFQGKILEDEKLLSDYNLTEKGFIVLMIVKPKPKPAETPKPAEEPKAETSTETAR